jgi:arabinogalactan endo-1,4-beta-galactosidase
MPVEVTFRVSAHGEAARFIDGDFLGGVGPRLMTLENGAWTYRTRLMPGASVTAATAPEVSAVGDAPAKAAIVGKGASVIPLE